MMEKMAKPACAPAKGFKEAMDALCDKYRSPSALAADPLSIAMQYEDAADKEAAAWVAAHLAYGRVAPMLNAISRLLGPLGPRPAEWLRERTEARIAEELSRALTGWRWRFHRLDDMAAWLAAWKRMDGATGHAGIEALLAPQGGATADQHLSDVVQALRRELPKTAGLRFNLPDPTEGAACKRWRMFLRWMARSGWPDLGLWKKYPPSELIIPLDTHVHRISRQMGICSRRSQDARAALEITAALKELDPTDPLKYDFAIAHLGILGDCDGKRKPKCIECPLGSVCAVK
jgi:uncharacterized protein (TIGR02757 family)